MHSVDKFKNTGSVLDNFYDNDDIIARVVLKLIKIKRWE